LDTSVARVAISASGIASGAAGAEGARGAGGFDDSVVFCSAAPTKIGGSEQATSPTISEEQRNDRSNPRALSRGLSLASLIQDYTFELAANASVRWRRLPGKHSRAARVSQPNPFAYLTSSNSPGLQVSSNHDWTGL